MSDNRIERVVIAGASGNLGRILTEEVVKTGKHTVTALIRAGGSSADSLPAGVKTAVVDYDDAATLAAALRGQQFLVIAVSIQAVAALQDKLLAAAATAGVPHVMPNFYGSDVYNDTYRANTLNGDASLAMLRAIHDAYPAITSTPMVNSAWYEYSLAVGPAFYGFDLRHKKATLFDDGRSKINTTTWRQCGRALAALLSLPIHSTDGPAMSAWFDKPLYVSSFLVSQRDMLDSLHRVIGTTDSDWSIAREPARQRYEDARAALAAGAEGPAKVMAFARAMYTCMFFPGGGGDFETERGTANKQLGLPVEDLDEATARAVDMALNGWVDAFYARFSGKGDGYIKDGAAKQ
ncbi:putative oxidoreductase CipA [Lasiosphaeria ovina]|uniref:Oxidoreductase CipA n=1 Tax=Lasiosphaeria ovina TaxID=92902 RepID=A0AAE0MYE8_9PEZI|nr:putative oxidoreductase CipA [Lasiosphaeria ovina]